MFLCCCVNCLNICSVLQKWLCNWLCWLLLLSKNLVVIVVRKRWWSNSVFDFGWHSFMCIYIKCVCSGLIPMWCYSIDLLQCLWLLGITVDVLCRCLLLMCTVMIASACTGYLYYDIQFTCVMILNCCCVDCMIATCDCQFHCTSLSLAVSCTSSQLQLSCLMSSFTLCGCARLCDTMFTVCSTLTWAVLTGQTDWVVTLGPLRCA